MVFNVLGPILWRRVVPVQPRQILIQNQSDRIRDGERTKLHL